MADLLESIFATPHPLVGMVHLLPLPGSPRWGGDLGKVVDRAVRDAKALKAGGADGAVIENYGDLPFLPGRVDAACVAAMAVALRACVEASGLPFGVNVLRNDAVSALGIAMAAGGRFIRVNVHTGAMLTDQGILDGRAHETIRERARLGAKGIAIFADVLVKHGAPLTERNPRQEARDAVDRGMADAVLVTGPSTGVHPDYRELAAVGDELEETPVLVASGIEPADMRLVAALADGVLAGTSLKKGGQTTSPVDVARVKALAAALRRAYGRK
jgi:membrane complex biogenesis BtpA family protein